MEMTAAGFQHCVHHRCLIMPGLLLQSRFMGNIAGSWSLSKHQQNSPLCICEGLAKSEKQRNSECEHHLTTISIGSLTIWNSKISSSLHIDDFSSHLFVVTVSPGGSGWQRCCLSLGHRQRLRPQAVPSWLRCWNRCLNHASCWTFVDSDLLSNNHRDSCKKLWLVGQRMSAMQIAVLLWVWLWYLGVRIYMDFSWEFIILLILANHYQAND